MSVFLKPYLIFFILSLSFTAKADERILSPSCFQRFFRTIKTILVGEDKFKSTYSFTEEQLIDVKAFLNRQNSEVILAGLNEKMMKFQNQLIQRYSNKLDVQAVNAFGKLDEFTMADESFSARVKIVISKNELNVDVSDILNKSAYNLGKSSKSLDLGMARFFATINKGIEYRLSQNEAIFVVRINPRKVVNKKLKNYLEILGFRKISEMPGWEEIKGFREGFGPAAEFEMIMNVVRKSSN